MYKPLENEHGVFQLTRTDETEDFVCGYCHQPKTSKVSINWKSANKEKKICNGCYGELRVVKTD
tara:strand:- start:120 stop:311 length:192 start_codon:yes stop_codon:yes gene_type:complete